MSALSYLLLGLACSLMAAAISEDWWVLPWGLVMWCCGVWVGKKIAARLF